MSITWISIQSGHPTLHSQIYSWDAKPVLIEMISGGARTSPAFAWGITPELVLYSDGQMIVTQSVKENERWKRKWLTGKIGHGKICRLLTAIQMSGFFELTPEDYQWFGAFDVGGTTITIQGWVEKSYAAYNLHGAMTHKDVYGEEAEGFPAELENTVLLIENIIPSSLTPYNPAQVVIGVNVAPDHANAEGNWPISDIHLSSFIVPGQPLSAINDSVLSGTLAQEFYELMDGAYLRVFHDGDEDYVVLMRPLFPYETWVEGDVWSFERHPFLETPTTLMTCP